MPASHLKKLLNGSYALTRVVDHPLIETMGVAEFSEESPNLISYVENGHYYINSVKQNFVSKRYFAFDSKKLLMLNEKKAMLHEFRLPELIQSSYKFRHHHKCKNDSYIITVSIGNGVIKTHYEITGPSKNYNIETTFIRTTI